MIIKFIKEKIKSILIITGIVGIAFAAGTTLDGDISPINGEAIATTPLELKLEDIKNQIADIQIAASDLNEIVVKAEEAILTEEVGGMIIVKIDLTIEQKQSLSDEYQIRKQKLIDAVNALW